MMKFVVAFTVLLSVAWAANTTKPKSDDLLKLDLDSPLVKNLTNAAAEEYKRQLPQNYQFELLRVLYAVAYPRVMSDRYDLIIGIRLKRVNEGKITSDDKSGVLVQVDGHHSTKLHYTFFPPPPKN